MATDLHRILEGSAFRGSLRYDEPMGPHTSFRVGGPADVFARPRDVQDIALLLTLATEYRLPLFPLGAGANILVADRGIRGIVLDLSAFDYTVRTANGVRAGAGTPVSRVSAFAADRSLGGLEFIYAMPGSVGGSVWMNARCYGTSISDRLSSVYCVDEQGDIRRFALHPSDFGYKISPFQTQRCVIVEAEFALSAGSGTGLWRTMTAHYEDRKSKGHFLAPSVGSVFKNNRDYGRPSGMIIDSLGLRGSSVGGAAVNPQHANIIVNNGTATATDILRLIEHIETHVYSELGFRLEREVILVGDWDRVEGTESG